jgi:hypothetical protein
LGWRAEGCRDGNDLNNPTLADKLQVTDIGKGLSDYLTGEAEEDELVLTRQFMKSLHCPCGMVT